MANWCFSLLYVHSTRKCMHTCACVNKHVKLKKYFILMRIINIVHNCYATEMATAVYKLIKEISVTIFMKAL